MARGIRINWGEKVEMDTFTKKKLKLALTLITIILILVIGTGNAFAAPNSFTLTWSYGDVVDSDVQTQARWWIGDNLTTYTTGTSLKGTVAGVATSTTVDYSSLSDGTYQLNLEVFDGYDWSDKSSITFNVDGTAPTAIITGNPGAWTNSNVTLSITATDGTGSGVKQIIKPDSTVIPGNSTSYVATTNGAYNFVIEDNAGNVSTYSANVIYIDKTPPTVNAPTVIVNSSTQITVQPNANDTESGLSANPYQYNRNGSDVGVLQSGSLTDTGLNPNTPYEYKYKAEDAVGNISNYSATVVRYTLANDPTVVVAATSSSTAITFTVTNDSSNGVVPDIRIEVKLKGAGIAGANVSVSDWDSSTVRTISGLTQDTEYEAWIITRNGDGIVNMAVKYLSSVYSNITPGITLTTTASAVKSAIVPYNTFTVSGSVYDADANSVTVSATINGVTKSQVINPAPITEPGINNYNLYWDGSELTEGVYTNIPITVTDSNGASSTVNYTENLTIDKTIPVVTITSSSSVDIAIYHPYVDMGATANDNINGDITANIITTNNVDTSTMGAFTVQYYVYDAVGNQSVVAVRTVNVRNYGAENLATINPADIIANSQIVLPIASTGQAYNLNVSDTDTLVVLVNTTSDAAAIHLSFVQGHRYTLVVDATEGLTTVATRIINITYPDTTPPDITGAYMLYDNLYVIATDNYLLHNKAYAFTTSSSGSTVILSEISGGGFVTVGYVVNVGNVQNSYFDIPNSIPASAPEDVTVFVRDASLNCSSLLLNITANNSVVYGVVPASIQTQINAANSSGSSSSSLLVTQQPVQPEVTLNTDAGVQLTDDVVNAITTSLSDNFVGISEQNLDSSNLTVSIGQSISNIQNAIQAAGIGVNVNYRLDIFEKATNMLVYTKQNITDVDKIISPNLQDSTMYVIRLSVMVNDKVLAFKEVEKETADKTPPVIEQVVLSSSGYTTDLAVLATDNKSLDDSAYMYSITDSNGNPISFAGMPELGAGNEVILASSGNGIPVNSVNQKLSVTNVNNSGIFKTDVWTGLSKLKGLDSGVKVTIKVRDRAGNITQTTVALNGSGTINTGVNANNPLTLNVGISNINTSDIVKDLYLNMQINKIKSVNVLKTNLNNMLSMPLTNNNGGFNIDDYEITSDNPDIAYINSSGKLVALKDGIVTLTIKNKKTGEIFKYLVNVGLVDFDRRCIVEVGSMFDMAKIFNTPLLREFGNSKYTFDNITKDIISIDDEGVGTALNQGLAIINVTDDCKTVKLYIIAAKDTYPSSDVKTISQNMMLVVKIGDVFDIRDNTSLFKYGDKLGDTAKTDYMIVEATSDNITILDNCMVRADKSGKASFRAIDLVSKKMINIELSIEDFTPTIFTDIDDNKHQDSIRFLASNGLVKGIGNGIFNADGTATREQFLTLLNRMMVNKGTYSGTPVSKPEGDTYKLIMSDWCSLNVLDILKYSSEQENEYIFGANMNLKRDVTKDDIKLILNLKGINVDVDGIISQNKVTRGDLSELFGNIVKYYL